MKGLVWITSKEIFYIQKNITESQKLIIGNTNDNKSVDINIAHNEISQYHCILSKN